MLAWHLPSACETAVAAVTLHSCVSLCWAAQYNTWLLIKLTPKGINSFFLASHKLPKPPLLHQHHFLHADNTSSRTAKAAN